MRDRLGWGSVYMRMADMWYVVVPEPVNDGGFVDERHVRVEGCIYENSSHVVCHRAGAGRW